MRTYDDQVDAAARAPTLVSVIGQAVADGLNPKAARNLIADKVHVSLKRAEQYAQTDITGSRLS